MGPMHDNRLALTRRHLLGLGAAGLGSAALSSLLSPPARAATPAKAKRAIFLFMNGGPSQLDLWDHKPQMADFFDKDLPDSVRNGQRLNSMSGSQARLPIAPSKYNFARHGQCGTWVSELLPWTAKIVDDLAVVRSVHTEAITHDPAMTYLCTGSETPGRPSLGAWLSYGLGSPNKNLPAFIVMTPTWTGRKNAQALFSRLWGSGFLPSKYQGVALRSAGDPVLFLSNPEDVDAEARRKMLDALAKLNQKHFDETADPETLARIAQYEMAFRMQTSVPDVTDLSKEPQNVLKMYGPDVHKPGTFAASCLLARRLVERDVRFVQIFDRGWDQHADLPIDLPLQCQDVDRACYALIADLKRCGLLDETLVVWGGEFGRTAYCHGPLTHDNYGRDHHPRCFTMWMAGGGIKGGVVHGETDDFSYNVVRDPVSVHEVNATILHCLGIDHKRLAFKVQGLQERLTGAEEQGPVMGILK